MPKISVVIPAHNEANYIKDTLYSIKEQTWFAKLDVIVICDTCIDDTFRIVKEFDFLPLQSDVKKVAASRNLGANLTQTDILVFNDADTIMGENYLESVNKAVREGYDYGAVQCVTDSQNLATRIATNLINAACKSRQYFSGNFFIKKDLFNSVGGFDTSLTENVDLDLADRVRNNGSFIFLEDTYVIPSTRRFERNGPTRELMKLVGGSMLYMMKQSKV